MKIAIVGLGYVGITSMVCLAEIGHDIFGVEHDPKKLQALKAQKSSIVEPQIEGLLSKHLSKIFLTDRVDELPSDIDLIMICVGTPSNCDGSSNLVALRKVLKDLSKCNYKADIIIRSTIPVGTCRLLGTLLPTNDLYFHPEFLREGSAVEDFFNPPKIVVGSTDEAKGEAIVNKIYPNFKNATFSIDWETAEAVKYADNIFHALKVTFTNEISSAVTSMSADPNKVMEIFCADQQLNISTAYLKPGFAYGGSCLQKDLDSFLKQSQKVELPLLGSIAESNEQMISKFVSRISHLGSVFIFNGLTFKENVDDLRNSPFVSVVLQLLKLDKTIYAFDDNLHELYGDSNRALNSMTQYPNFHLNVGYKQKTNDVVISCHKALHSGIELESEPDFLLYPNSGINKIFA